jgi:glycosyltransferase involved in cell wall biosynthesis
MLSVVAPVFNEERVLAEFHRRVCEALEGTEYELILVDDGSSDESPRILREIAAGDARVRVIELSRNFGHQAALSAGLDRARGEAVAWLDSDLQDPPEVLREMVERWHEGAEVVYAVRRSREGEGHFKLRSANGFYRVFSRLARMDPEATSGDYRLLDRRAVDVLRAMPERNRFLRGMTIWVGFDQQAVPYDRDARYAGETKFTLRRMVRFSMDAITSFSNVPLQFATLLGFTFSVIAFLGIPVAIGFRIAGEFGPGVATILLVVLMLGGIQLITLGIVGEYIGRIYEEVKGRPLYVVRGEVAGGEDGPGPA